MGTARRSTSRYFSCASAASACGHQADVRQISAARAPLQRGGGSRHDLNAAVPESFGSLLVQRDQWDTSWGAKKNFGRLRAFSARAQRGVRGRTRCRGRLRTTCGRVVPCLSPSMSTTTRWDNGDIILRDKKPSAARRTRPTPRWPRRPTGGPGCSPRGPRSAPTARGPAGACASTSSAPSSSTTDEAPAQPPVTPPPPPAGTPLSRSRATSPLGDPGE